MTILFTIVTKGSVMVNIRNFVIRMVLQGSAKKWPAAKSGLPGCVYKILLEHTPAHLFTCLWLLLYFIELTVTVETILPTKLILGCLLSEPFQKKFADPCAKCLPLQKDNSCFISRDTYWGKNRCNAQRTKHQNLGHIAK